MSRNERPGISYFFHNAIASLGSIIVVTDPFPKRKVPTEQPADLSALFYCVPTFYMFAAECGKFGIGFTQVELRIGECTNQGVEPLRAPKKSQVIVLVDHL